VTSNLRIGTSGWQYKDWRGVFYPPKLPQRLWLEHYTTAFDTVEVNATFYRLPQVTAVARWAEGLPEGFVMTIKASRYLTHVKRLREPAEPVSRLLDRIQPLRDRNRLGPILLQLPPHFTAAPAALSEVLGRFPDDLRLAVEPRDPSWFKPSVRAVLHEHQAALVWADRHGRATSPLWDTCDWLYVRFHTGRNGWGYERSDLRRWATRVRDRDAYVYFNNDPGGAAVTDAVRFRELVTSP
jgi:uncharacterized protein YecE (DUF72 family)